MPQLRVRDAGGVLRTITRIRMRDTANVLRTIQKIRGRDSGATLRTLWQYLSVTLSTYYITASDVPVVSTASVTSTVAGGTGPFTYLWEFVSGTATISAFTPTASSTVFKKGAGTGLYYAVYRLKVTDSLGAIAYSDPITVEIEVL